MTLQIVILHQIYQSYCFKNEITTKSDEKEKAASLPVMPKTLISGLLIDFESATWIQISCYVRMHSPTVVFRGVDRAVGKVWPSTDLRQTFSVEQGPGTPMVGRKL